MLGKCCAVSAAVAAVLLGGVLSGEFSRRGLVRYLAEDVFDSPRGKGMWPSSVDLAAGLHWTFDDLAAGSLAGKTGLVTGGNTGLGYHTALELARKGATVVIGCRSEAKCSAAAAKMNGELDGAAGAGQVVPLVVDMASFESVAGLARQFRARFSRLDMLVLNAGIPPPPQLELTADGIERTMQTNHFGSVLLTTCLRAEIEAGAAEGLVRIVVVSSVAHYRAPAGAAEWMATLEGINSPEHYAAGGYYGLSKLANVLLAKSLSAHFGEHAGNVVATSCHPGMVATDIWENELAQEIARSLGLPDWLERNVVRPAFRAVREQVFWPSDQGAWTQTYLATSVPKSSDGLYFHQVARAMEPTPAALDGDLQRRFFDLSLELTADKCKQQI